MLQVVIPMTGYGSRFKAAGYEKLKPFIKVGSKTMIEWVISMYPEGTEFVFICRENHYYNYREDFKILENVPNSVIDIRSDSVWEKLGPVNDVVMSSDVIYKLKPTIINYCDFFCTWDVEDFLNYTYETNCDGAIPCYTGFHPHLIPNKNVYASCLVSKSDNNLIEIREKYSFEKDKTKAHHSPGIYYFKNGKIMLDYCKKLIDSKQSLNGEYYASLVYNKMIEDGKTVKVLDNVDFFCQWGTPEDLEEFNLWMDILGGKI